jgi:hypothetical protein
MKKIILYKVKELLEKNEVDESTQELLLNNISLYNTLLGEFQKGERHNSYLLYQLNSAIQKEILAIKIHKPSKTTKDKDDDYKSFESKFKIVNE